MSLDKDKLFAMQRDVLEHHVGELDTSHSSDFFQRVNIAPELGEGYCDFHHFEGMVLGRADCCFKEASHFHNENKYHSYGIQMLLSGELNFNLADIGQSITVRTPEIWINKGDFGAMDVSVNAGQRVCNILIEFSPDFVNSLGLDAHANSVCHHLIHAQSPSFMSVLAPSAEMVKLAWQLYDYAGATNKLELMAIQGVAYALASHLLTMQYNCTTQKPALSVGAQRAKELLDTDYQTRFSIPQIARHAGVNECDLKRDFKRLTGSTINHYQRTLRMRQALVLLQTGEPNLAVIASSVGYKSKDYFVRVFSQYYGFHPKDILHAKPKKS